MNLLTPFLIGLFSSVHCLAMCGGLCGVFCRNNPSSKTIVVINFGRIITYTLLGALFAGIIQGLAIKLPIAQIGFWIRSLLGLILVFLGLRILRNKSNLHSFFENNFLWQKAKKQLHKITKLNSILANLSKGLIWGLIPCGLLYGVLLAAATTHNVFQGGLFMLAFGLGTLPSMFVAAGLINTFEKKLQSKSLRYSAGIFIIIIGFWSLLSPWFSHEFIPNHPVFTSVVAFLDSCIP
jgi:sulfite exporter TauE/SafE